MEFDPSYYVGILDTPAHQRNFMKGNEYLASRQQEGGLPLRRGQEAGWS